RTRRYGEIAQSQRARALERRRFIGPRTPDTAVRHEPSENRPATHRRTSVRNSDRAAVHHPARRFVRAHPKALASGEVHHERHRGDDNDRSDERELSNVHESPPFAYILSPQDLSRISGLSARRPERPACSVVAIRKKRS